MFARRLASALLASTVLVTGAAGAGEGDTWYTTGGSGHSEVVSSLATAPGGGVYAAVFQVDHSRVFLMHLDGLGKVRWRQPLGTSAFAAPEIAATPDGGVAVLAPLARRGVPGVLTLVAVGADGDTRWRREVMSAGGLRASDRPIGIHVADSGDITIGAGLAVRDTLPEPSTLVARFDAEGHRFWQTVRSMKRGYAQGLAVADDGTAYVAEGRHRVAAFSSAGEVLWESYVRAGTIADVEAGGSGAVVLVNHERFGEPGFTVVRLSARGRRTPVISVGHAGVGHAAGLARLSNGNLLVAGQTYSTRFLRHITNGDNDFFAIELGASGGIVGSIVFGAEDDEFARAVVADAQRLFIAGATTSHSLAGEEIEWIGWLVARVR